MLGLSWMSGGMPTDWMLASPGVRYFADGELEPALVVVVVEVLDRSLPERALADDDRAVLVLERPGDDLGRRRAHRVHEHGDRVVGLVVRRDARLSCRLSPEPSTSTRSRLDRNVSDTSTPA
jgi:hypothetical protein